MMISKGVEDINVKMPNDVLNTNSDEPSFNVHLTAIVRDSEGRIIKVHRQRSHSPTANFIALLLPVSFFTASNVSVTVTNTGGSKYSYQKTIGDNGASIPYPNSSGNEPSYFVMIQVGSGQQSNPYTAIALAAPISNGSGAGQLIYSSVTLPTSIAVSGNSASFYISQTYNNNSGSTITITEVGIIVYLRLASYNNVTVDTVGNTLVWYDVLSSAISVPNGGSVTIYYTFTVNP